MGRPLRTCLPNLTYHVFSRCINCQNLLKNDFFKDLFLEVIKMAQLKYDFRLITYQIMNNHFHLIIRTTKDGPSISVIMQFIKSVFARKYNKLMKRTGPFWNERFGDSIVEMSDNPEFFFFWLKWYIGYNPVKKKMVNDPRDYKYSSINYYLNKNYKSPLKITLHPYFMKLGETAQERLKKFLYYEELYLKYGLT